MPFLMSRGTAFADSAMTGMWVVEGSISTNTGQIYIHQNHVWLIGARQLDAQLPFNRRQQFQIGAALDQLLDQFQICRIVLDIKQRPLGRQCGRHRVTDVLARFAGLVWRWLMYCRSGKLNPEYAAGADTAFDADGATHQLDQLLGHHQSDAGAFFGTGLLAQAIERLEELGHLFRCQSDPGILDAHPYPAYVGHHHALDDDYAPDLVVLDRIR